MEFGIKTERLHSVLVTLIMCHHASVCVCAVPPVGVSPAEASEEEESDVPCAASWTPAGARWSRSNRDERRPMSSEQDEHTRSAAVHPAAGGEQMLRTQLEKLPTNGSSLNTHREPGTRC